MIKKVVTKKPFYYRLWTINYRTDKISVGLQEPVYRTNSNKIFFVARWKFCVVTNDLSPILGWKTSLMILKHSEKELQMVFSELVNKRNQNWINKLDVFQNQGIVQNTWYNRLWIYWYLIRAKVVLLQKFDGMVHHSPETTKHSILKPVSYLSFQSLSMS